MTEVTGGGHLSDGEILSDVDKKEEEEEDLFPLFFSPIIFKLVILSSFSSPSLSQRRIFISVGRDKIRQIGNKK